MRHDGAAGHAAELAAYGGTTLDEQVQLISLDRAMRRVVDGEWWSSAGGPAVTVRRAQSSARSSSARDALGIVEIRMAVGQLDLATLTHELAHALAGVGHDHDDLFRRANVDIVAALAGASAAGALATAYAEFGLALAARPWPAPTRGSAPGFVIVP